MKSGLLHRRPDPIVMVAPRDVSRLKTFVDDRAEALRQLRQLARASRDSHQKQNYWAERKLRAEREAGEILRDLLPHKGGRPAKNGNRLIPLLRELGITKMESSRWQRLASIPEPEFEKFLADAKRDGGEITRENALRLAGNIAFYQTRDRKRRERDEKVANAPKSDLWQLIHELGEKPAEDARLRLAAASANLRSEEN